MPQSPKTSTDSRTLREMARYRNALPQDWSREMEFAADALDAQEEQLESLRREVENLRGFIKGAANNMLVMIDDAGAREQKSPVSAQAGRFIVHGRENSYQNSLSTSDGQHPPFVVFDGLRQDDIAGPFPTREVAQKEAGMLNDLDGQGRSGTATSAAASGESFGILEKPYVLENPYFSDLRAVSDFLEDHGQHRRAERVKALHDLLAGRKRGAAPR